MCKGIWHKGPEAVPETLQNLNVAKINDIIYLLLLIKLASHFDFDPSASDSLIFYLNAVPFLTHLASASLRSKG